MMSSMKQTQKRGLARIGKLIWPIAFFVGCFNGGTASAYTITVVLNTQYDGGTLQVPASGTQTFTIDPQTGGISGSGVQLYGSAVVANFTVRCTSGCTSGSTLTVQLTGGTTGDTNLSWPTLSGSWDNGTTFTLPKSGLSLGNNVAHNFKFSGTASYTSAISVGVKHPTYSLQFTTP